MTGRNWRLPARRRLRSCFPAGSMSKSSATGLPPNARSNRRLLDLAYRASLPLVATNEVFFAATSDYEAHDALICIADGTVVSDGARRQLSPSIVSRRARK